MFSILVYFTALWEMIYTLDVLSLPFPRKVRPSKEENAEKKPTNVVSNLPKAKRQ